MRSLPTPIFVPLLSLTLAGATGCPGGDPDPVVIDVKGDRAALLAGREVGDPWQTLTANAGGDVAFEVSKPFELVGVCEDWGGEVYAYAGGPEDAEIDPYAWDIGCGAVETVAIDVSVTNAPGDVYVTIGWLPYRISAGSAATIDVPAGAHDVFIVDRAAHTVMVRRGVDITAGMTLDVDFAAAQPMAEHPVVLAENGRASSYVVTPTGDRTRLGANETVAYSLPPSMRAPGDVHRVTVREAEFEPMRSRARTIVLDPARTAPIDVTLPAYISAATLTWNGVPSATYTVAGDWEQADLFGYQSDEDVAPMWFFLAYPNAERGAGSITAPDARSVTGWKPSWDVDPASPFTLTVNLQRPTTDGNESVSWTVDTTPPAKRAGLAGRAARADERALVLRERAIR